MLQSFQHFQFDVGFGNNDFVRQSGSLLGVGDQQLDFLSVELVGLERLDGGDGQLVAGLHGGNAARDEVLFGFTALGDDFQKTGSELFDNGDVVGQDTQVTVHRGQVDLLHFRVGVEGLVREGQRELEGVRGSRLSGVGSDGSLSRNLSKSVSEHGWDKGVFSWRFNFSGPSSHSPGNAPFSLGQILSVPHFRQRGCCARHRQWAITNERQGSNIYIKKVEKFSIHIKPAYHVEVEEGQLLVKLIEEVVDIKPVVEQIRLVIAVEPGI